MESEPYESRLIGFALKALEEAAARGHWAPVRRTWALRLALAYLGHRTAHGGAPAAWAFELYWRLLEEPNVQDRWGKLNTALNGIYVALGLKRDLALVSHFEQTASRRDNCGGPKLRCGLIVSGLRNERHRALRAFTQVSGCYSGAKSARSCRLQCLR
jgi:hypothetical protein